MNIREGVNLKKGVESEFRLFRIRRFRFGLDVGDIVRLGVIRFRQFIVRLRARLELVSTFFGIGFLLCIVFGDCGRVFFIFHLVRFRTRVFPHRLPNLKRGRTRGRQ